MNKKDVIMLIEEWLRNPPGSRPLLDKAIAEQYRKAVTSRWEGQKHDNLAQWLRENLCGMRDLTVSEQDDLDNHVAAILDGTEARMLDRSSALPLAAFKSSEGQKQMRAVNGYMPTDDDIAARVKKILDGLSSDSE